MNSFGDSEMFCLEFVARYKELGHQVQIYTIDVNAKLRAYCNENNVEILDPNSNFSDEHFDLLWIHHNVIPREFLIDNKNKPTAASVIFHHMTPYDPSDISLFPSLELKLAKRLLANTNDVKIMLEEQGFLANQIHVVGSPVTQEFLGKEGENSELNKFLFISHNAPHNVLSAISMLGTIGFEVRTITTEDFDSYRNGLSPSDFQWADAIIATEQAVTHALLSHRPIFLYSKNTGLGWLKDESDIGDAYIGNRAAEMENFELSTSLIIAQLLADFEEAKNFVNNIDPINLLKFQFDFVFDEIVSNKSDEPIELIDSLNSLSVAEKTSWHAYQELMISETKLRLCADRSVKKALIDLASIMERFDDVKSENSSLTEQLEFAHSRIQVLENSGKMASLSRRSIK
jgi:hypothetical protein